MELPLIILLLVVLIFTNAFFAASEMAIVSVNKNKLKMLILEGNTKAPKVFQVANESSKFLSTIQVGITLAGFFSSATAAKYIADDIGVFIARLDFIGLGAGKAIAFFIVTVILSYIMLILGELVPKRIALKYPEKNSFWHNWDN